MNNAEGARRCAEGDGVNACGSQARSVAERPGGPEQRTLSGRELAPMAQQVRRVLEQTQGDVLVFLPGSPEIHRLREQLEDLRTDAIDIVAL